MDKSQNPIYEFGPYRLETAGQRLTRDGTPVILNRKSYEILLILVLNAGRDVEKERLLKAAWPNTFVEEGSLAVNISALRKALGEKREERRYIETVPRIGYRFVAEVRIASDVAPGLSGGSEAAQSATNDSTVHAHAPAELADANEELPRVVVPIASDNDLSHSHVFKGLKGRLIKHPYLLALVCLVVLGSALSAIIYIQTRADRANSIAVIPFVNGSGDPEMDYLSDGVTEIIINKLSVLPNLKVIARTTMFRYKGRESEAAKVGRELNVGLVLTGKVLQQGEVMSIQVELVDVSTGKQIWGEKVTRRTSDLVSMETDVANKISMTLRDKLSGEDRRRLAYSQTDNSEAHRLYLIGRYFWNKRNVAGFKRGIEYFQKAIEKDPNYALAYAGIADCYGLLGAYLVMPADEAFPAAKSAALKAIELDDSLAEGHTSLALVSWLYDWDWEKSDNEFRRAAELNPSYVLAHHWRGLFLGEMARFDEAAAEMERAIELDPASPPVYADYGRILFWARRYPEALEKYQMVEKMGQNFGGYYIELLQLYEQMNMNEEWYATIEYKIRGLDEEMRQGYRSNGITGYWRARLELLRNKKVAGYLLAELNARVGDKNDVFPNLEVAFRGRDHLMTQLLVNPSFDSVRSDSRFTEMLRRMNLRP